MTTYNFRPDRDEAQAVVEASDTLNVELSGLHLSEEEDIYCSLIIRTQDGFVKTGDRYEVPNELEKRVFQRVGYTPDFLGMLQDNKITETQLRLLNPAYVVDHAAGEEFIGRGAWRERFDYNAQSNAETMFINNEKNLRGVRKK